MQTKTVATGLLDGSVGESSFGRKLANPRVGAFFYALFLAVFALLSFGQGAVGQFIRSLAGQMMGR
jgi:hypothetical protein